MLCPPLFLELKIKNMRKKRRFYRGVPNHIYQRAQNGFNLFYCDEDRLVFYTIFAVCARKAPDIKVLGLCLMYDHFHSLIIVSTCRVMADRISVLTVASYQVIHSVTHKAHLGGSD